MIKLLISLLTTIWFCGNLFSQNPSGQHVQQNKIISSQNGFINYESGGVEGFQEVSVKSQNHSIPISEWDLNLCNEVLFSLEQKILISNENGDVEAIHRYQLEKATILMRKSILAN